MNAVRLNYRQRVLGAALPALLMFAVHTVADSTPPTQLIIRPDPLHQEDAAYNFQVTLSTPKTTRGVTTLRISTTIVKTPRGQTFTIRDVSDGTPVASLRQNVTFRDIVQTVPANSASFQLTVDGQIFVFEACYYEIVSPGVPPRAIPTTFGQMFAGGQVGMLVRISN